MRYAFAVTSKSNVTYQAGRQHNDSQVWGYVHMGRWYPVFHAPPILDRTSIRGVPDAGVAAAAIAGTL